MLYVVLAKEWGTQNWVQFKWRHLSMFFLLPSFFLGLIICCCSFSLWREPCWLTSDLAVPIYSGDDVEPFRSEKYRYSLFLVDGVWVKDIYQRIDVVHDWKTWKAEDNCSSSSIAGPCFINGHKVIFFLSTSSSEVFLIWQVFVSKMCQFLVQGEDTVSVLNPYQFGFWTPGGCPDSSTSRF